MEGEHTTNNDCIIDERLNIHIPGELWEQLGNPQWVEVDAENGLPEYFSIRIAACPKETPVGSDGSIHLDEIFAAECHLFAGMRFIPVVSGMERKFLLLNLVRPYCTRCGDIDGLFDGSRSGHTVYFCKSCIQELSEMIQE